MSYILLAEQAARRGGRSGSLHEKCSERIDLAGDQQPQRTRHPPDRFHLSSAQVVKQQPAVHEVERLLLDLVVQEVGATRLDSGLVIDEARSFIRRSPEHYDVIQADMVDTWAATSAGAFALTENNLYTVEAFRDYAEHLKSGGILTITRWFSSPPE